MAKHRAAVVGAGGASLRQALAGEFLKVFADFFRKDRIVVILAFLLLFRFEALSPNS